MGYQYNDVVLKNIRKPKKDCVHQVVMLSDKTLEERKIKVLTKMKESNIDALVIYADLEHGSNFEYLTGFLPRFEEALLILHADGKAYTIFGNENYGKASKLRIKNDSFLYTEFSLPKMTKLSNVTLNVLLEKADLNNKKVGLVGWKIFDDDKTFDFPHFIMKSLIDVCKENNITNATNIFIGDNGLRTINNANEIAHYEYGSSLAGDCILNVLDNIKLGISEIEAGKYLSSDGQKMSVVPICAFGQRFINANLYPTNKMLELGDSISLTVGYKGGLTSMAGYAVSNKEQLSKDVKEYFNDVCKPYFTAIQALLENIKTNTRGGDVFDLINKVLPQSEYGWKYNPGHLTADEEWLVSPIYKDSNEILKSGMLFQTDIIPSVKGYAGVSCEGTFCLADKELQNQIKLEYPKLYERMMKRREYIINEIGIKLSEEVLPMSSTLAYLKPYMLSDFVAAIAK